MLKKSGITCLAFSLFFAAWAVWARWIYQRAKCDWDSQLRNCIVNGEDLTSRIGFGLYPATFLAVGLAFLAVALLFAHVARSWPSSDPT